MNNQKIIEKVHSSMYRQCKTRGYATPVDVLIDMNVLTKQKYEDWRFGRVDYLEHVCMVNLHKLTLIMHEIRVYAMKNELKPSYCFYKQWGVKKKKGQNLVKLLRFSKSQKPEIERWYATHFIDSKYYPRKEKTLDGTTTKQ